MTTLRKAEANRRNALRSTGPRTSEGKAASARNSMKHGLLSEVVLPFQEDERAFIEFQRRLTGEIQPVGELETVLVDRIVSLAWRLQRAGRVEAGLFTLHYYDVLRTEALREADQCTRRPMDEMLHPVSPYELVITDQARHGAAIARARAAQTAQDRPTISLARAFVAGQEVFANVGRYEAALEHRLYRTLSELQRLQAAHRLALDSASVVADPATAVELLPEPRPVAGTDA